MTQHTQQRILQCNTSSLTPHTHTTWHTPLSKILPRLPHTSMKFLLCPLISPMPTTSDNQQISCQEQFLTNSPVPARLPHAGWQKRETARAKREGDVRCLSTVPTHTQQTHTHTHTHTDTHRHSQTHTNTHLFIYKCTHPPTHTHSPTHT